MKYVLSSVIVFSVAALADAQFVSTGPSYQGKEVTVELPTNLHLRNRGGSDGLGLCVFASITHAGHWQGDESAKRAFEYMFTRPGGGYPSKVDAVMKGIERQYSVKLNYIQHEGGDEQFLRLALKTGRYPCVTYDGRDGVYYRGRIAHMVNLAYLDDNLAAIHDNNYPGKWLWMPRSAFLDRWRGNGGGWAIVFLNPPPPPIPTNKKELTMPMIPDGPMIEQCPGGICPTPVPMTSPSSTYKPQGTWFKSSTEKGTWYLVGSDNTVIQTWHEDEAPSMPAPDTKPGEVVGEVTNYGVDTTMLSKEPRYSVNGHDSTRRMVYSLIESTIIDDSTKPRIVCIGDEQKCKSVETAFLASKYKDSYIFQQFRSNDWRVADVGYGDGITVVEPGSVVTGKGQVLDRIPDGDGAKLVDALRRRDPDYKPDMPKPDEPKKPDQPKPLQLPDWMNSQWVPFGILLVVALLLGKRESK